MNKRFFFLTFTTFLLLSAIGYGAYWVYSRFETHCESVDIGYQGEARYNPFLASQRFLLELGIVMRITSTPPILGFDLNAQDTLILWEYSSKLSEYETEQLLQWVDAGGHLIMASDTLHDQHGETQHPDPLLHDLKIFQYQNHLTPEEIAQASPTVMNWHQQPFQVAFNPDYYLESYDGSALELSNEYGTHLLHYYYGTGMITVLSDLEFIENDSVDDYDHAWFFWQLLNFEEHVTKHVLLVRSSLELLNDSQIELSLWQLLWNHARMVIISAIVLICCWLWLISRRFGPLIPEPPLARRRLLEHIEASGYFFWRQRQAALLIRTTQQAVLNRLSAIHPEWSDLPLTELSLQLAPLCGLPAREIAKALTLSSSSKYSETNFTQKIQILTTIRKSL